MSAAFEAWLESTGTIGKNVHRQYLFWVMARVAEDRITDSAELLAAARRAVPYKPLD